MTIESPISKDPRRVATLVVLAAAVAAALGGCVQQGDRTPPAEVPRNVRVLELKKSDLTEAFELSGAVRPVRGTDVSSEEGGVVRALPHDKGERVDAGDVLVSLDRRLLAAELSSARAADSLQSYDAVQTRRLYEAGKVSRVDLLTAESRGAQAASALAVAARRFERAAVPSPFAGLVSERYVELGQLVAPGTRVARVVDPFTLKLAGWLTERDVAWLKLGAPATVSFDGVDAPVSGRVGWIGFEADPVTGKFPVEIHIDNPDLALRPGVVARARVLKRTHPDVLVVPRDAVLETGQGRFVYVVDGDHARRRRVTLGPDQGLLVMVTAGLEPGERLVVRGQRDLIDGALVKVTETADARDGSMAGDPTEVTAGNADAAADLGGTLP